MYPVAITAMYTSSPCLETDISLGRAIRRIKHFLMMQVIVKDLDKFSIRLIKGVTHNKCRLNTTPPSQTLASTAVPSRIHSPELGKLILINHSQSREMFVKKLYYAFGVPGIRLNILSLPRKMSTLRKRLLKSGTDVRIGVMNVPLCNKLDCLIDHITDNRIDIVGITETRLSNDDKNNMSVVNTCLNNGYTLLHSPRNTGSRGGGVGVPSTTGSTSNRG